MRYRIKYEYKYPNYKEEKTVRNKTLIWLIFIPITFFLFSWLMNITDFQYRSNVITEGRIYYIPFVFGIIIERGSILSKKENSTVVVDGSWFFKKPGVIILYLFPVLQFPIAEGVFYIVIIQLLAYINFIRAFFGHCLFGYC